MCGIAGIVTLDSEQPVDSDTLVAMLSAISHRGPDDSDSVSGPGYGLAACRLSIIGLSNGRQPITNEDGTLTLVCNGEIYNHIELRAELERAGHRFRTESDVEVILHAYEDDPRHFWQSLRGMFAFALWDANDQTLWLGRDRLGIKPLHYALTPNGLVFGSEQKAILAAQLFQPELDKEALHECFLMGYARAPRTLIRQIRTLMPGHRLSFRRGEVKTQSYWDLSFPHAADYCRQRDRRQWAEALGEQLESLPRAIWHREQPSSLGVGISRMLLSGLAAGEVKVVLTGEGADEILGGYPWYRAHKVFGPLCAIMPKPLLNFLAEQLIGHGRWAGAGRILKSPRAMNIPRFLAMTGCPDQASQTSLLGPHLQIDEQPEELTTPEAFGDWHPMGTPVARFLNGPVDQLSETGHEGQFFTERSVLGHLELSGFEECEVRHERFTWDFPNLPTMLTYCWHLFGLTATEPESLEPILRESLGFQEGAGGVGLNWSLLYARGRKLP
jgi:asparagine synthetase B (glutamine-hydrolysing)